MKGGRETCEMYRFLMIKKREKGNGGRYTLSTQVFQHSSFLSKPCNVLSLWEGEDVVAVFSLFSLPLMEHVAIGTKAF